MLHKIIKNRFFHRSILTQKFLILALVADVILKIKSCPSFAYLVELGLYGTSSVKIGQLFTF